eukprot:TRINITY_DN935_c1_g2_i2.p1 TRINITY_DN935_c1_g2~~TRINITY_DN935_c1_g2_i2.p1  ORF type:complete len:1458 (+),score=300.80 TRINITY_DN935_c1_g2_i2:66-4376(+)
MPRPTTEDTVRGLEEQLQALRDSNRELRLEQTRKDAEMHKLQKSFAKVQSMVRTAEATGSQSMNVSGVVDLEHVPIDVLPRRGAQIDGFIKSLQERVQILTKRNAKLTDSNAKMRARAAQPKRGALPRYLQQRKSASDDAVNRSVDCETQTTGLLQIAGGDRVRVRDGADQEWKLGRVTGMHQGKPLVTTDGSARAFTWVEVERVHEPTQLQQPVPPSPRPAASKHPPTPSAPESPRRAPGSVRRAAHAAAAKASSKQGHSVHPPAIVVHAPVVGAGSPTARDGQPQQVQPQLLPPPSAAPLRIDHISQPPSSRPPPDARQGTDQTRVDALVARAVREYAACSEDALSEKSQIVKHMEAIIRALQSRLEDGEGVLNALRDEVLTARAERDTAVKNRDLAYRERDMLTDERDYAVRAKSKMESDVISLSKETEALREDRRRLAEEREQLLDRNREERGRWQEDERQKLGTLDGLQLALKEKSAAVVMLDQRCATAESAVNSLKHTNADMLQQMEALTAELQRERVRSMDLERDCDLLRMQVEGIGAVEGVAARLRQEKQVLEQAHAEAVRSVLETRNATEAEVRRLCQKEADDLKLTISKWEAASRSQFRDLQLSQQKIAALQRDLDASQSERAQAAALLQAAKADAETMRQRVIALVPTGDSASLTQAEVERLMAALDIVRRAEDMKDVKGMLDEFTGGESGTVDAVLALQRELADARHKLELGRKQTEHLERRLAGAERDAAGRVAAAADRAARAEQTRALDHLQHQEDLKRKIVRAGRKGGATVAASEVSAPSTLSIESSVTDSENIIEIKIGRMQVIGSGERAITGGAPGAEPVVVVSVDFWVFESCATKPAAGLCPDFDSSFVYRIALTDDLKAYLQNETATVQLRADNKVVAVGALRLSALLCTPGTRQLEAPITLLGACTGAAGPVACLGVRLRLKKPLPEHWRTQDASELGESLLDGSEIDGLPTAAAIPPPTSAAAALERIRLAGVTALGVTTDQFSVNSGGEAVSLMLSLFPDTDLWLQQSDDGSETTVATDFSDPSVLQWLFYGVTAVAAFNDAASSADGSGADCIGWGKAGVRELLTGPSARVDCLVELCGSSGGFAGSVRLQIRWIRPAAAGAAAPAHEEQPGASVAAAGAGGTAAGRQHAPAAAAGVSGAAPPPAAAPTPQQQIATTPAAQQRPAAAVQPPPAAAAAAPAAPAAAPQRPAAPAAPTASGAPPPALAPALAPTGLAPPGPPALAPPGLAPPVPPGLAPPGLAPAGLAAQPPASSSQPPSAAPAPTQSRAQAAVPDRRPATAAPAPVRGSAQPPSAAPADGRGPAAVPAPAAPAQPPSAAAPGRSPAAAATSAQPPSAAPGRSPAAAAQPPSAGRSPAAAATPAQSSARPPSVTSASSSPKRAAPPEGVEPLVPSGDADLSLDAELAMTDEGWMT